MLYCWNMGNVTWENRIFVYGANEGQRIMKPCHLEKKNLKLILLRNGKFYSFDKING